MKNIFKSTLLLLGCLAMLTACSDDNDSNPTFVEPSTFTLNTPSWAPNAIDLANSKTLPFTWSQPNYAGSAKAYPVAVNYSFEVSSTDSWTTSNVTADADKTGATVADYYILDDAYHTPSGSIDAAKLATALEYLSKWKEDAVPEVDTVFVRCKAQTPGPGGVTSTVYSNTVQVMVNPYYVELRDAPLELWYLVGNNIGAEDGGWKNSEAGTVPLLPVYGNDYDKKTGRGEIEWEGFLPAGTEFKLVNIIGNWDIQWGSSDGSLDNPVKNDGGAKNFTIATAGYYKVVLNTATDKLSITPVDGITPSVFTQIAMPGSYQPGDGWDPTSNVMTAKNPLATENHDWTATVELKAGQQLKFAADGAWTTSWGSTVFPYGIGKLGGDNINVTADGTYTVYFNDITGYYYFVAQ
jgi:hypothetical protein